MAGHSQFKNIMYRKGAQDAKRAKVFTKLIRELTVASRAGGVDPNMNPRLRSAVVAAKTANVPKDTMERAISRGSGESGGEQFDEIRYEGYGPGGVAIIVEAVTDNRNRTVAEIRAAFSRHGGNLGETGSVSFLFERIGDIHYPAEVAEPEPMFETALDAGAEDIVSSESGHDISCAPDDLNAVSDAIEARFGPPDHSVITWRSQSAVKVEDEAAETLLKLLEVLEDSDDVQAVSANYEIADDVMARLGV